MSILNNSVDYEHEVFSYLRPRQVSQSNCFSVSKLVI